MTTALYRRYRPDSFEDVIGQEHVTVPLMTALSKDRVNHAYLFSGPRGCGKTTSARVLARCLNCAEGPTPNPCGTCDSCRELATGGPGALDVIEIDAASHGGVDDARDLRERATFAPVRDRYKIFIIDEAHMVTSAGFNALLKIVEEPPPHIKFIFATTEPDKVIGTIRSRTHHYPFRLVPPEPLMEYLERLCVQEGVDVEPGVLSLVIRSGGGSVRDTLSVLDQLMAGAAEGRIGYDLAVNLLGYTPGALLDDVVDAVAAADSQTVFRVVDRVVQSGQDPRRFVEDLLERFRDLVIVKAMPDAASSVLHGMPDDQLRRLEAQAAQLGAGEISRAADITNQALTEMVGATSPRLHLELLMARLMLPSSDATERGLAARLDRIERRLAYGGTPEAPDAGATVRAPGPATGAPDTGRPAPGSFAAPTQGEAPSGAPSGLSGAALARAAMKRAEDRSTPASAHSPASAPSPAPAPEAPRPQVTPSADWGGGWGVMPEPQPQQADQPQRPAADRPVPSSAEQPAPVSTGPTAGRPAPGTEPAEPAPVQHEQAPAQGGPAAPPAEQVPAGTPRPETSRPAPAAAGDTRPEKHMPSRAGEEQAQHDPSSREAPAPDRSAPSTQGQPGASASQVEMIRRAWPEVLAYLEEHSRLVWMLVSQNASVAGFDGQLLTIGFSGDGPRDTVQRRGGDQVIAQAVHAVLGIQPRLDLITGGSAPAGGPGPKAEGRPAPAAPRPDAVEEPAAPDRAARDAAPAAAPPSPGPAAPAHPDPASPVAPRPAPEAATPQPTAPQPTASEPTTPDHMTPAPTAAAWPHRAGMSDGMPDDSPDDEDLETGSEPVEEGATGPGTPAPPEDLEADSIPVSDWYGEEPHDDAFPPPPEPDEEDRDDVFPDTRPSWGERPEPGLGGMPLPEPGQGSIPRPVSDAGAVARPEPGRGGIPSFARPEAELQAEFEARMSRRGSGASASSAPEAGPSTPAAGTGADGTPHHRRASRFQQMMEQYQRTQDGAPPPTPGLPAGPAGNPGPGVGGNVPGPGSPAPGTGPAATGPAADGHAPGGAARPGPGRSVDWDDVPSDDDVTIEESGMAGRKVVERLLGGRLVEERMLDGSPLS
ncbi:MULTISPECIES: DNA polymerase III subunit gamma and tau [Citricoccus]|uniref:DNA polymerase III subunit gamma and tau n=1 Tax=Citricoccus TaxID=169133 RepID=UPI000255DED9|nr:DNA polymerase III subunit gamma and tau [Citricoccus sp. CH26A]